MVILIQHYVCVTQKYLSCCFYRGRPATIKDLDMRR